VAKVKRRWQLPLYLAATVLAAGSARAQSLTAGQILQQFNAVIFGNFSSSADVEGRAVIDGNLTGAGTFYINPGAEAASTFAALSIYGASSGNGTINLDNGGGITVGGLNNATLSLNGGNSVFIGGANSGNISVNGGATSIGIVGNNTATISASGAGSITVGGTNSGNGITVSGTANIGINNNNSATIAANGGGTIKINGTSGNINGAGTTNIYLPNVNDKNGTINNATSINYGSVSVTTPTNPLPSFNSTLQAPLTALSTQLQSMTSNSTVSTANGTTTFDAKPNAAGQAVFNISASVLTAGNTSIVLDANAAKTIIINVTAPCSGGTCAVTLPSSTNFAGGTTSYAVDMLWNFYNATTLTLGSEFVGTVLAPGAAVSNGSPIDGDLIAASFSGTGELHNYAFAGNLNSLGSNLSSQDVIPEPSTTALLGVGIIGLFAATRRRSAHRAAEQSPAAL
jgi:choice-of-anchor A domain-containing protein